MITTELYRPYMDKAYSDFSSRLSKTDTLPRAGIRIPTLDRLAKDIQNPLSIEPIWHEDIILMGLSIIYSNTSFEDKLTKLSSIYPLMSSWDHTDIIATRIKATPGTKEIIWNHFVPLLESSQLFIRRLSIVTLMSNRKHYDRKHLIRLIKEANLPEVRDVMMAVAWAHSFFYLDYESENGEIFEGLDHTTKKNTLQKIRDSRRYRGEALPPL